MDPYTNKGDKKVSYCRNDYHIQVDNFYGYYQEYGLDLELLGSIANTVGCGK